jgi:molybdopterin-guanine dinucleotide biosynthesis protein A
VVADHEPGLGPLAGLATALISASGCAVIVLAWDMPFVPGRLLAELRRRGVAGVDAVVPRHGSESQPLCAWYSPAALHECRTLLASGERRATALADALPRVQWMTDAAIARFGDPTTIFASVDTPEALAAVGGALP